MATVHIVLGVAVAILAVIYVTSYWLAHNANTTIAKVLVDDAELPYSRKRKGVVYAIVLLLCLQWIGLIWLMTVDDDVAATDKAGVLWAQVAYYILQWFYVPILLRAHFEPTPFTRLKCIKSYEVTWFTMCKCLLVLAAVAQVVSSVYVIQWTLAREDLDIIAVFLGLYAAWTIIFDCVLYSGYFGDCCGCMVGIRMPSVPKTRGFPLV